MSYAALLDDIPPSEGCFRDPLVSSLPTHLTLIESTTGSTTQIQRMTLWKQQLLYHTKRFSAHIANIERSCVSTAQSRAAVRGT